MIYPHEHMKGKQVLVSGWDNLKGPISAPAASHQPRWQKSIYHWSANDTSKIEHWILSLFAQP
ncbi:hypothetical protein T03_12933 [Trichinella britovi]|uniref:Uncharacterized protein n=1 Tax=Trichinella britovi TaxID=45882 RepID=A0A0V1APX0_TRIBR|nr:hypothetical protein T03_12933 [Trichinella britovi]